MKITKPKDLAFGVKPFGVAGKRYVGLAAMAFLDLTAPDGLLSEQDLWKAAPAELGEVPILDEGMPKTRGEVLLAGACHAPRGATLPASRVRFRLGSLEKSLNVFGERFWLPDRSISQPRPFSTMPLTWNNAFGGADYPQNPKGKGLTPVAIGDGRAAVPLPNLELPGRMVGGPDDRPEPAGFGPLDPTWPQRGQYQGTFDERWKAERWPDYPDDTNFLFFNRAPGDQQIQDYFRGDEEFLVENMHPDMPLVQGRLPGLRPRLFLTLIENYALYGDPAGFRESFLEVPARLETVWFFPSILRAVLLYRGSTQNRDDECRDVVRAYLAWERPGERPGTLEEYAEKQRRAADRSVTIDTAPFAAANKKLAAALKQVKNSPKTLARIRESASGRTPTMPVSAEELAETARTTVGGSLATIDRLEAVARDLSARFGHLAPIDLGRFEGLRQAAKKTLEKAEAAASKLGKALQKAEAKKAEMLAKANENLENGLDPALLASRGFAMENLTQHGYDPAFRFTDASSSGSPFHDAGFPLVVAWRRNLENDPEARAALRRLGLPDRVQRRAWLGINPEAREEDGAAWGLPAGEGGAAAPKVVLPAGLVLPRFDGPLLSRILIRPGAARGDFADCAGEVLVPGSTEAPLALPAAEPEGCCWVRAATELEALFLEEEIGDACGVAVLAEPKAALDPDAAKSLKEAPALAVILPAGESPIGDLFTAWKAAHPNAVPVIPPKAPSLFAAKASGEDARALIMAALPPDFAARHALEAEPPGPGRGVTGSPTPPLRFPELGLGAAARADLAAAQAAHEPLRAELEGVRTQGVEAMAAEAAKHGKSMDEIAASAAADGKRSPAERGAEAVEKLAAHKERLRSANALTPDLETTIDASIARTQGILDKAEAQYQAGLARIAAAGPRFAAAKEQFAAKTIPGLSAPEMAASGLDPEAVRPMTRPEVVERHKLGLPFAKRNLSGLDLSELDLTGVNLSGAILRKTSFSGAILDGADLRRAIAQGANFSRASLAAADLSMGLFMGAKLRKANLSGAKLKQTALQKANLEKADLSGADLRMAVIQDANLRKARFAETRVELTMVDRCDLTRTDFRGARLRKTAFRDLAMNGTDFSGASLHSVGLSGVTGRKLVFAEADMTKFRMGKNCKLPGTDFRGANLSEACLRESDLSGSDFRRARLDGAMIELCDLGRVDMNRISARKCSILKTDLSGANLHGVNLFMGSLRKSRLTGADLGRSNLYGVDVFKVVVGGVNVEGANLKRTFLEKVADVVE